MPKHASTNPTDEDLALAHAALLDITTADTIGEPTGSITEEDGSLTVYFDTTMAGYRGWKWTVSLAHVKGFGPSVLETELTPGDGALLSPDWVPWSERLADYKEAQSELTAHETDDDDSDDSDDDDSDDDADDDADEDDFDDEDVSDDDDALLHSGDLDGVDIDSLDFDSLDEADDAGESELPSVGDDEAEQSEGESGDAAPQPPVKPRRNQRAKKQQHPDEGE